MRQNRNVFRGSRQRVRAGRKYVALVMAGLSGRPQANAVLATAGLALQLFVLAAPGTAQSSQPAEWALFEEIPVVQAAALYTQTLEDAPAHVTVITRQEIATYGYRTLAEALSNVTGFYVTQDGATSFLGSRGFAIPGDYATRILIMINGHYMTDNVRNANGTFLQDFGLDMDLIQRIEVIRGPSSALYGSNGVFATINVVTQAPVDHPTARVTAEVGSFGEMKEQVSSSMYLGKGVNLLVSGSVFHGGGRSVLLNRDGGPGAGSFLVDDLEQQSGYHSFVQATWRNWSFMALMNDWRQPTPLGAHGTRINDPESKYERTRDFVDASYRRSFGVRRELNWQIYFDRGRSTLRLPYDDGRGGTSLVESVSPGNWLGSRLNYSFDTARFGRITVGSEARFDIDAGTRHGLISPVETIDFEVNDPHRSYGFFAQQEFDLSSKWTTFIGARVDDTIEHGSFVSPRAGLLYKPSKNATYKLLYGRAFRNASVYEEHLTVPGVVRPNRTLGPENLQNIEFVVERRVGKHLDASAAVYRYWIGDLILVARGADGLFSYQNTGNSNALGTELEIKGRPVEWLEFTSGLSLGQVRTANYARVLVNSPKALGYFRCSVPLGTNKVWLASSYGYASSRKTRSSEVGAVSVVDLTVSTRRLHPSFDIVAGVKNALDRTYWDPVGDRHIIDAYPRRGRTAFVKLVWQDGE